MLLNRHWRRHDEIFRVGRRRRMLAYESRIIGQLAGVAVGSAGGHLIVIGLAHDGRAVDEGKSVLHLEAAFVIHLDVANLLGWLALVGAQDREAAEVLHLRAAGVGVGTIPGQANSLFHVGGLEPGDFFGSRRLRRNRLRLHAISEEHRVCQRNNHKPKRNQVRAIGFQIHRRPSSLRRRLTVDGAGPPSIVRRATEFSARSIAIASAPNVLECRRKSSMLKSSSVIPASVVSRTIAPTISCASRKAVPRLTRYSARSVASANPPAAARMRFVSKRSFGQNFASRSSAGFSASSASNTRSLSSCKSEL